MLPAILKRIGYMPGQIYYTIVPIKCRKDQKYIS